MTGGASRIASGGSSSESGCWSSRALPTYTHPHPARRATAAERAALAWKVTPTGDDTAVLHHLLTRWRADPIAFAFDALRFSLMPYQAQALLDLADSPADVYAFYGLDPRYPKRKVLLPSGHGLGKTMVCAIATWWHMLCHKYSKRLVTAPTADQLTGQYMGEVRKCYRALARNWPDLADDWDVQGTGIVHKNSLHRDWQTMLRTARADKPEALQGGHALDAIDPYGDLAAIWGGEENRTPAGGFLIIIEEASGVDDTIRKTLEGSLSEAGARLLAPGNPTRADGWFANDIKRGDQYAVHHLDCRLSNLETVYALPYRPPRAGAAVTQVRTHGYVRPAYWESIIAECDGDEEADYVRVRVRGLPPVSNVTQVIRGEWVDEAMERGPDADSRAEPIVIAGDFGQTQDKHAATAVQGFNLLDAREWLIPGRPDTQMESAFEQLLDLQEMTGAQVIIGDSNGVGAGVMSRLSAHFQAREQAHKRVKVIHFQAGAGAIDATRYGRRRDEMWFRHGRAWLSSSRCHLLRIPGLKQQLTAPGFIEDERRIIKLETKDQIRKRTGQPSGNLADAVLMAVLARHVPVDPPSEPVQDKPDDGLHPSLRKHFKRLRAGSEQGALIR